MYDDGIVMLLQKYQVQKSSFALFSRKRYDIFFNFLSTSSIVWYITRLNDLVCFWRRENVEFPCVNFTRFNHVDKLMQFFVDGGYVFLLKCFKRKHFYQKGWKCLKAFFVDFRSFCFDTNRVSKKCSRLFSLFTSVDQKNVHRKLN